VVWLLTKPATRLCVCALLLAVALLLVAAAPAGALLGCGLDPWCILDKGAGGVVSQAAGDAITALAKSILGALASAVQWAATLWVGVGTPPIADSTGQATGTVAFLQQNLLAYTTGLAVLCTLLGAGRIVYHEHKAAQLRDLGRYLATYVLVSAAAAGGASVLVGGADQLASWFIARASTSGGFADHLATVLGLATSTASGAAGTQTGFTVGLAGTATTAFIAILLGIVAFVATVIQIMLMLARGGMLVMLVGTLPLAAAFSNTEIGLNWFRKASGWLIAFALYKPAAAIVYAVAFDLAGQQGALALLDGVMTLVLAILALPALLRFVVPATSALAGGGGPGGLIAATAGGALAMRIPTGAAPLAANAASAYRQTGQDGGPPGATPPSAAPGAAAASNGTGTGTGTGTQPGTPGASGQPGTPGASGQPGTPGASSGQSGARGVTGTAAPATSAPAAGAASSPGAIPADAPTTGATAGGGAGAAAGGAGAAAGAGGAAGAVVDGYRAAGRAADRAVRSDDNDGNGGGPTGASPNRG